MSDTTPTPTPNPETDDVEFPATQSESLDEAIRQDEDAELAEAEEEG